MSEHRFYLSPDIELKHDFWLHDMQLVNLWNEDLRFQAGQELVLFDGVQHERLYRLVELNEREAHLELVTDYVRKLPSREVYLFWALLLEDKNDQVLQKCTELGVSHFIPLLADHSEKISFDLERAKKILIKATEQCGRSDIPAVREPMNVETALKDYKDKVQLFICDQSEDSTLSVPDPQIPVGVLIGSEAGWSIAEEASFKANNLHRLNLDNTTLRVETAAIAAASKLLQLSV